MSTPDLSEWMANFDRLLMDYGQSCAERDVINAGKFKQAIKQHLSARPQPQAPQATVTVSDEDLIELARKTTATNASAFAIEFGRAVLSAARPVAVIPESAVLERLKYHWHEADPELPDLPASWEAFPPDVDCATCIPVLVVRADAVQVAASPSSASLPETKENER